MTDQVFLSFSLNHGCLIESVGEPFFSRLSAWHDGVLELANDGTHFGYVHDAAATLEVPAGTFVLNQGMYFAVPSSCRISGPGRGIVMTKLDYRGVFMIGGPIEAHGRLRYIDGCTDSLLIPPQLAGDPCLNSLYFPPNVSQTEHTHPSIRMGLIVRGGGQCRTREGTYPLSPGQLFIIQANGLHSFRTMEQELVVLAFHPDSDFGPTDLVHPMINRTLVDGIPASKLDAIKTRAGNS
jgi:hypothetical protein